ncbi:MAG: ABC transporter ATP-binding protein [Chloroflexi bacterium]|nr:ABC transporter ATP-binding protein [Chloroflexota bacterium]
MAFIDARDLRKTYDSGRRNAVMALRGVDLVVERGEIVALMGPSGSGKSTLMHLLGLLHGPDRDGGPPPVLRIGDRDVATMSDGERTRMRAREMGFVFQSYNLVTTLTAVENVALAAEYAGARRRDALRAAGAALERVGLGERGNHRPHELSGGEQQRVALARSMINEPPLLLADEPTGNLDSGLTREILGLFRDLNRERGQTMLLVTHDPEVGAAADRIVRMRDGLTVAAGQHAVDLDLAA